MFGFLNVYKPKGKTSHDVVAILRRVTKIKQIGHTGTLDPFAEGVLPVCIGKSTRLIEYLNDDKAYIGTVQLGKATNTYDTEGEVTKESKKVVSIEEIQSTLKNFTGEIEQIPPIYSAIKVNGKKLYEYARKGEEVEIKPRKVSISNLELISYNQETMELELYIECSKGTYIRSIANDLGETLGTYGYLTKLVRVKAGNFRIESSVKLEEINTIENVEKKLITPLKCLDYPVYELNCDELKRISNGNSIKTNLSDGITILLSSNEIAAIAEIIDGTAFCRKVFV